MSLKFSVFQSFDDNILILVSDLGPWPTFIGPSRPIFVFRLHIIIPSAFSLFVLMPFILASCQVGHYVWSPLTAMTKQSFFFPSHLCSFMAELVMLPIDWLAVRLIDLHSRRAGHWWMAVTVPGPSSEQRRLLRLLLTSLVLLYFSRPCLVYNSCLLITRCHLYPFTYSLQLSLHPSILLPSPAVCSPLMPPTFFNAIENQCWG